MEEGKRRRRNHELIPGLPDEIAMECLVRVPYKFHSNMRSVCFTWRDLISHPCFYQQRLQSGFADRLICLLQPLPTTSAAAVTTNKSENHEKDPKSQQQQEQQIHMPPQYGLTIYNATRNSWHRTRTEEGLPLFAQILAIPSAGKVLVLGGWDPNTLEPVPDVHVLEFIGPRGFRWRRGASMSVARSFFACAVVGASTVYVAGGHDSQKNALRSAQVYDVGRDEWRWIPDMIEGRDECQGMGWEGDSKFWVVSGYGTESQGQFRSDAECYDPETESWSRFDGVWPFSSTSPRGGTTTITTTTVSGGSSSSKQHQWWWLLGGESHQQHGETNKHGNNLWEIINSIPLPDCIAGTTPCVTTLGNVGQSKGHDHQSDKHKVFVMSGGGGGGSRSASSVACGYCDGEAFMLERCSRSGGAKWNHIHTPVGFSGFPYSASNIAI